MKKSLLATTALTSTALLFGAGVGHAQVGNFNGLYIGVGGGGDLVTDRVTTDVFGDANFSSTQYFGTITGGFNWNPTPFLLGFEADLNFIDYANGGSTVASPPPNAAVNTTLDHLLTLRARAGVQTGRLLIFATGGLAAANATLDTCYPDLGKVCTASGSGEDFLLGFSAGGGFELAATDRVSLKFDALYYQLHDLTVNATGTTPYTAAYQPSGLLFRGGINVQLK